MLVLAAWAILAAQAMPTELCFACDQPCCAARNGDRGPRAAPVGTEPDGGCPLCAAAARLALAETADQPCNCRLDTRHDQPLSHSRNAPPVLVDDAAAIGPAVFPTLVPHGPGISREYVATSLTVPIRPARILFGVWRN